MNLPAQIAQARANLFGCMNELADVIAAAKKLQREAPTPDGQIDVLILGLRKARETVSDAVGHMPVPN